VDARIPLGPRAPERVAVPDESRWRWRIGRRELGSPIVLMGAFLFLSTACAPDDPPPVPRNNGYPAYSPTPNGTTNGTLEPPTVPDETWPLNIAVTRFNVQLGPSLECYTFYENRTVELRHGGRPEVNNQGTFSGDQLSGIIAWADGKEDSTYQGDGENYTIDDADGEVVPTCIP
jgi:hypothetical protein